MHWYLVHTKPRQEKCALENLERQGYQCYLPIFRSEKILAGKQAFVDEPLFPRYLFIRLDSGISAKSWSPIRSTKGVNKLVSFGAEATKVPDQLVDALIRQQASTDNTVRLFSYGERVLIQEGIFADIEGIYQKTNGDQRAMILIQILGSKPSLLSISPSNIRKVV